MVLEHGYNTKLESAQHKNYCRKQKTNLYFILVKFSYKQQREEKLYFAGNMEDAEMSTEEENHPENTLNREEENITNGEIWVELNDCQDNKSEL